MSQQEKDQLVTLVIFRYWKNEVIAYAATDAAYTAAYVARAADAADDAYAAAYPARSAARESQNGQLEK